MRKFFSLGLILLWASSLWAGPAPQASFEITPPDIDFGILRSGKVVHRAINMTPYGPGAADWILEDPAGCRNLDGRPLQGSLSGFPQSIIIALKYDRAEDGQGGSSQPAFSLQLGVLAGNSSVKYALQNEFGSRKVLLGFKSKSQARIVSVRFDIPEQDAPVLNVEASSIDFGSVEIEKNPTGQLKITNRGSKKLHWKIEALSQERGRFFPFYNEECRGKGAYSPPSKSVPMLQISGSWKESEGLPLGWEPGSELNIQFTGNSAALSVRKDANAGLLNVVLDDIVLDPIDCLSEKSEVVEVPLGDLPEGIHRLKLTPSEGNVVLTGIRVFSKDIIKGPSGWIKVFPEAGDTTSETDYVNIKIQTDRLEPGIYAGGLAVRSNGGYVLVDVSIRVTGSAAPKIITIYKYIRGVDFLYTADPETEGPRRLSYYKRQGAAFRLFKENTPGTRKLLRWYHPGKGDHYYSSDPNAKALQGYIPEGSIGNIATSKLPGTREFYRWRHGVTGLHVYTLDGTGEGYAKKGYKLDAIVGFVR